MSKPKLEEFRRYLIMKFRASRPQGRHPRSDCNCRVQPAGNPIARTRNVVSQYLVHHTKGQGRARVGSAIRGATIAQEFAAIRDDLRIGGDNPPTFHEIRSLAARLWKEQGVDVRVLLGHKTEAMSALYQDARGAEWVTVSAG